MVASWVRTMEGDEPVYMFEAQASYDGVTMDNYVAVGFSRDTRMQDDTVAMSGSDLLPTTMLYWNIHDNTMPVEDPSQEDNNVENENVSISLFLKEL